MNKFKSAAIVAAGLLALAGCQKAPVDTTADEAAIKQMARDFATAYAAGDADAIAAMYAEDAVLMPPGAPKQTGPAAIREYFASNTATSQAAGVTLVMNDDDVAGITGDIAWHSGSYLAKDASGAAVDSGHFMVVSRKADGKWLVVRDIWNSDRPPPPAEDAAAEPAAG